MDTSGGSDTAARARWAAAFLGSAAVLLGGYPYTLYDGAIGVAAVGVAAAILILAGVLLGSAGLALGVPLLVRALRTPVPLTVLLVAAGVATLAVLTVVMAIPYGNLMALMVLGGSQLAYVEPGARPTDPATRFRIALPFSAAMLALLPIMILQVTVWNPLAKLPGLSLDQIYGRLAAVGEPTGAPIIIVWAVVWGGLALAFPVFCRLGRKSTVATTRRVVIAGLLLVAMVGYTSWITAFGMGMSMADTFEQAPSGGDAAPVGKIIAMVGQLSAVAALFVGCPAWRPRLADPVPVGSR
ncbi:hypothetical protein [Microlunatus sp. GCM10028923]|uniref:hypothetical protein n=1 Tax=Microlunatus sp. GCM10028923 TaxID=3273400 RepID=UPI00360CAA2A